MVSQRLQAELKHPLWLPLDQPNPTQPNQQKTTERRKQER